MFTIQQKSKARRLSPPGLWLAEEEHDQEREKLQHLLITQLKLECQLEHGKGPVYAGSAANWLRVGFGGYEEPAVERPDSLPPDDVVATTPEIACRRWLKPSAADSQYVKSNV